MKIGYDCAKTDRDRYRVLYDEEKTRREILEDKHGEDAEARYLMEKELAERRIRMKYTEAIIQGVKDKNSRVIEEMKELKYRMAEVETAYDDAIVQRDEKTKQYEDRVADIKETEERIHHIHT